jgi:hypothetical protein
MEHALKPRGNPAFPLGIPIPTFQGGTSDLSGRKLPTFQGESNDLPGRKVALNPYGFLDFLTGNLITFVTLAN